jgi:hypothetical protein
MQRNLTLSFLLLLALPLAARASTIDDVTLTGDSHTFTFILPGNPIFNATIPSLNTTGTADSVSGYSFTLIFADVGANESISISALPPDTQHPFFDYHLFGVLLTAPAGQNGTPGHRITDGQIVTGTFNLIDYPDGVTPDTFTITVTPEPSGFVAAAPEPSTLAFFATGALGLLGLARRATTNASPNI